ncbi:MAG: DASS family sodium-coupled anion symporter [Candidatus Bathyarchaeota archaeon]|nr:DASS family sodium-coupled anion symporter [Candidatus Bathyarchaeota archaeon]
MEKERCWKRLIIFSVISVLIYFLPLPVSHEAKVVFSILILAALLWITETLPLFLTSLLVTVLIVLFKVFTFKEAVTKFADPVLVLFFGGFLIARAMQDVELDKRIALQILSKFKDDKYALLALMFVTAFLSMWISNTATTVVMIPIALGIVHKFKKKMTNFLKATVLGIAYSANIGGVGTILGSPPNAITVAKLSEMASIHVLFLDWMKAALPLVIILVPIAWWVLLKMFPFEEVKIKAKQKLGSMTRDQKIFAIVFGATVLLWLTTSLTGLSSSLIALMSAVFLFLIRLLRLEDINRINYRVLMLFGGGLVLGSAMFATGLSEFFANSLAAVLSGTGTLTMMFGIVVFSIILGALASNTATAAILIPVILPLAQILNFSPKNMAMLAGIAVSFDYLLPVGTPPNAIAYSTGHVRIKDMLKAGGVLTVVSIIVLVLYAYLVW